MCNFFVDKKIRMCYLRATKGKQKTHRQANGPERKIDMIELATAYAAAHGNTEEAKNDAANIYSSNYEEYMEIWAAIKNL